MVLELLTMSRSETKRLEAMASLKTKALTQVQVALQLRISERQVRRLWLRFQREGAAGIFSRKRGRQSNNRLHPDIIDRAVALVADRYADFGRRCTLCASGEHAILFRSDRAVYLPAR